jgi:hypothetical protein
MKKLLALLLFSLLLFNSCSEDTLVPVENTPRTSDLKVKAATTVTGLTNFKVADLGIPTTGLYDGTKFCNGKLRACVAYYPYGIMKQVKNGLPRVRFYVKPTAPSSFLVNTLYPYHHRAEITRYPWTLNHPCGTEEWIGFSYIFPTAAEGFTQNRSPVSIYQNHSGRLLGRTVDPPALQLEIAYPGQLKNYADPYYQTPLGGEIMIINNVRGIRYVAPGVRVVAGARLDIVMQIVYGLGDEGLFNVWINGKLMPFLGNSKVAAGNVGSTVWPPLLSGLLPVGGNSKLGLYHHQLRFEEYVTLNAKYGHTNMQMWMTDWNDVFRQPGDWDYKSTNAFSAVDTSTYP